MFPETGYGLGERTNSLSRALGNSISPDLFQKICFQRIYVFKEYILSIENKCEHL